MLKSLYECLVRHQAALVCTLPIIFIAGLIIGASVNIPFWDQWELVPVIMHMHSGDFYLHDLWQQHNEHRLFFPKLIMVAVAYVTHWDTRVEMLVGLAIAATSFVVFIKLVQRTSQSPSAVPAWLLFLCSLIWFSPVQIENWLWGWQIQWFLSVLGVMVALYGLAKIRTVQLSYRTLALLLAGTILAQYSLGNGTLLWPLLIAALVYLRVSWSKLSAICLAGFSATVLYYSHYANLSDPPKTLALHEPIAFLKYELLYFGRPLSFYHKPAMIFGILLLGCFIGLAVYLFVKKKSMFRRNIIWFTLGFYVIGSGLITGLARLGFGVEEAASSRYTTISSLLIVSTLVIAYNSRTVWQPYLRGSVWFQPALVLAIVGLVLFNGAWGVHGAQRQHRNLANISNCTHQSRPAASCLLLTYPNETIVRPRLDYLKQIHWGGY